MPDEQTVVNEEAVDPTAQPSPAEPENPPIEGEQPQEQHMVPSGRLKEEADKRRAAEAQTQQVSAQAQQLATQNQQMQEYLYRMNQTQQQPQSQETRTPVDDVLDQTFGSDEAGLKARRGVELLIDKKIAEKGNNITNQEVHNIAQGYASQATGQWSGTVQTANRLQALVNNGQATAEEMTSMQAEISERLQQPEYKSVASNPAQLRYVVSDVISEHLEGNKFSQFKPQRPQNPLQASGGGSKPPPDEEVFDPSSSPFSTIKNLSKEDSEKLTKMSVSHHEGGR